MAFKKKKIRYIKQILIDMKQRRTIKRVVTELIPAGEKYLGS